jgi:hypothetical protein
MTDESTGLKIKVGILAEKVDGVTNAVQSLTNEQKQLRVEIKKYYPEKSQVDRDITSAIQQHNIDKHAGASPWQMARIILAVLGAGGLGAGIKAMFETFSR